MEKWAESVAFPLRSKIAHFDRISREFREVAVLEFPNFRRQRVFFDERFGGEVVEERFVCGEGHVEAAREEVGEGVVEVGKDVGVGERRHGDGQLGDVEEILQRRRVHELDAVGDAVGDEEGADQVIEAARLAGLRAEREDVEAALAAEHVERRDVCPQVVDVIVVRRVERRVPFVRRRVLEGHVHLLLVALAVEAGDVREEVMESGILGRVERDFPQRNEDVVEIIAEVADVAFPMKMSVSAGNASHPAALRRHHSVSVAPGRNDVPFAARAAVDGKTVFNEGILVVLVLFEHVLGDFGEVSTAHVVIGGQEERAELLMALEEIREFIDGETLHIDADFRQVLAKGDGFVVAFEDDVVGSVAGPLREVMEEYSRVHARFGLDVVVDFVGSVEIAIVEFAILDFTTFLGNVEGKMEAEFVFQEFEALMTKLGERRIFRDELTKIGDILNEDFEGGNVLGPGRTCADLMDETHAIIHVETVLCRIESRIREFEGSFQSAVFISAETERGCSNTTNAAADTATDTKTRVVMKDAAFISTTEDGYCRDVSVTLMTLKRCLDIDTVEPNGVLMFFDVWDIRRG